jgi:uncharacterized membrane protein
MKTTTRHVLRLFATGLLAALPLAATLLVLWWLIALLLEWVGPGSGFGHMLRAIGFGVTGSGLVGYLVGMALTVAGLVLLGALVERGLERGVARVIDAVLRRIPLVRTVWDLAQRMVGLLQQRDADGARSMSPVWCHFGGPARDGEPGGVTVLGLLSSPQAVMVGGRPCLPVLVPTAPVPIGGGLLYVPAEWVTPASLGMEALTSIYVSMGVTSSQHLPLATGVAPVPVAAGPGAAPQRGSPPSNAA